MGRKNGHSRGAEYWRGMVEEWRRSGLKQSAYCRQRHLSYSAFYYWRRKLVQIPKGEGDEGVFPGATRPILPLAEVVLAGPERGRSSGRLPDEGCSEVVEGYEISLRGGRWIRLGADFDGAVLARLVRVLESC